MLRHHLRIVEIATIDHNQVAAGDFHGSGITCLQGSGPAIVIVNANDGMTYLSEANSGDETDVSGSDNCDLNRVVHKILCDNCSLLEDTRI